MATLDDWSSWGEVKKGGIVKLVKLQLRDGVILPNENKENLSITCDISAEEDV